MSFIQKNPLILEAIEESPNSRPHTGMLDTSDEGFSRSVEAVAHKQVDSIMIEGELPSVMLVDEDGDEDDGLPKTCEANDILVPQDTSNDHFLDSPVLPAPEEPSSATF